MSTIEEAPVDDGEFHADLDQVYESVKLIERRTNRKNWIILFLSIALAVAVSGWWLVSSDQTATERNGRVADCRSAALASTLDAFQIIVSPNATDTDRGEAASRLADSPSLLQRYEECERRTG